MCPSFHPVWSQIDLDLHVLGLWGKPTQIQGEYELFTQKSLQSDPSKVVDFFNLRNVMYPR